MNLPADRIEVYRKPAGERYADVATASRGATQAPLQLPDISLSVDRILG